LPIRTREREMCFTNFARPLGITSGCDQGQRGGKPRAGSGLSSGAAAASIVPVTSGATRRRGLDYLKTCSTRPFHLWSTRRDGGGRRERRRGACATPGFEIVS